MAAKIGKYQQSDADLSYWLRLAGYQLLVAGCWLLVLS